jgi:hypothetical protein
MVFRSVPTTLSLTAFADRPNGSLFQSCQLSLYSRHVSGLPQASSRPRRPVPFLPSQASSSYEIAVLSLAGCVLPERAGFASIAVGVEMQVHVDEAGSRGLRVHPALRRFRAQVYVSSFPNCIPMPGVSH